MNCPGRLLGKRDAFELKKVFFQRKPRRKTAQASRCQHTVTGYDDDERIF